MQILKFWESEVNTQAHLMVFLNVYFIIVYDRSQLRRSTFRPIDGWFQKDHDSQRACKIRAIQRYPNAIVMPIVMRQSELEVLLVFR